jgi:ribosomal protein S18 acetylase RimI-like enzyme
VRGGYFTIEPLGAHDRTAFSCGSSPLDRYLREQAAQDVKGLVARCFVLLEKRTGGVAGYYTLAATSVPAHDLPPEFVERLPKYPVLPAALIGHLAVDRRFPHRGLASALVADAANRVLNSDAKPFALIVEAKDERAADLYRRLGFRDFVSRPMMLFLSLGTAKKAAEKET